MSRYYAAREAAGMGPDAPKAMVERAVLRDRCRAAVCRELGIPAEADDGTILAALEEAKPSPFVSGNTPRGGTLYFGPDGLPTRYVPPRRNDR